MAGETELERLVVRLVGDAQSYISQMAEARKATAAVDKDLVKAQREIQREMERGVMVTRSVESASEKYSREIKDLDRLLQIGAISQETYNRALRKSKLEFEQVAGAAARFEKVGRNLQSAGRRMSMMITAPLAGIGTLATRESTTFEGALQRLQSLVGMTGDQISQVRDRILDLAVEVGKSPQELVAAYEAITSGGLRGEESLRALETAAKGSAIGMGSTAVVGRTASLAVAAYGKEALSTSKAMDILRAAAEAGNAAAEGFAPVMGRLLPTAQNLGVEFDEVAGIIAFMTRMTGDASQAATGLSGVMSKIQGAGLSKDVKDALGVEGLERLKQIVKEGGIQSGVKWLDQELSKFNLTLLDFFSDREAYSAALMMVGESSQDLITILQSTSNAVGGINEKFELGANTAERKFAQAMAASRVALVRLGEIAAPIMMQITQFGVGMMDVWRELSPEMQKVVVYVGAAAASIGPLTVALGILVSSIGQVVTAIKWFIGSTTAMKTAMIGLKAAVLAVGVYALYKLIETLHNAGPSLETFNNQLRKTEDIFNNLLGLTGDKQRAIMETIRGMDPGKEQTQYIKEQIEVATKRLHQAEQSLHAARDALEGEGEQFSKWSGRPMKALTDQLQQAEAAYNQAKGFVDSLNQELARAEAPKKSGTGPATIQTGDSSDAQRATNRFWNMIKQQIGTATYHITKYRQGQEEANEAVKRAKQLMDQYMSPLERYSNTIKELEDARKTLMGKGLWGAEQEEEFKRAAEQAKKTLDEATKDRTTNVSVQFSVQGAVMGSAEAMERLEQYRAGLGDGKGGIADQMIAQLGPEAVGRDVVPEGIGIPLSGSPEDKAIQQRDRQIELLGQVVDRQLEKQDVQEAGIGV